MAGLAAASVQGLAALGPRRGAPSRRVQGRAPETLAEPRCHARGNGFDLHADLVIGAGQRERLERVCRYVLRAPVAADRLQRTADDEVIVSLRRPWRDGTTAIVLSPLELIERLAVLVPRPRVNLLSYHGVLGARSAWRAEATGRFVPGRVVSGDPRSAEAAAVDDRRSAGITGPGGAVGGADAAHVSGARCAGMSPLRGAAPAAGPHRTGRRRRTGLDPNRWTV